MATIPKVLQSHINTAFPANVCLVGSVLPNGYAQVSPRGSTMAFDDTHIALWERGKGSTNENLADDTRLTVFFRKPQLREEGVLPKGGIARFYGRAGSTALARSMRKCGAAWSSPKRIATPEKKGHAVLIEIESAEDLDGQPLALD